jgi:hypothetical protein
LAALPEVDLFNLLAEAGVTIGTAPSIVAFWDALAAKVRSDDAAKLNQIGREGESLTLQFEHQRTGRRPKWTAIESNREGYDILSVIDAGNEAPLAIEVKTSTVGLHGLIHLTRGEWVQANQLANFAMYLWDISNRMTVRLAQVDRAMLEPHVAENRGEGSWRECEFPFGAFEANFVDVDLAQDPSAEVMALKD